MPEDQPVFGRIHLVSRNAELIDGLKSVVSVDDLPEGIDLAG